MDKIWNYKNFNMVYELDVAGEFIYDGIQTLNQMNSISIGAPIFSFLYHLSVGIERLQKIILVLFEDITLENYEEFEKSLITHSHGYLHERISKKVNVDFNSRENEFLTLLSTFYNHSRYNRFNFNASLNQEKELLEEYILKYINEKSINRSITSNDILINNKIKELFGKVAGRISSKYYKVLRDVANEKCTYTYELRNNSKAEKIFLSNNEKKSLIDLKITETIAFKELLLFISNTKERNPFIRFLKQITPLKMDIALINEYLMDIANGTIPQTLIDEVEYLYEENGYGKERIEQINLIGDCYVMFEYGEIIECIKFAESFLANSIEAIAFARKFPIKVQRIKDDDFLEFTIDVRKSCKDFIKSKILQEEFVEQIRTFIIEAKEMYHFICS